MAAVDMAAKADFIIYLADVWGHLSCISLKEPANTSNKKRVPSECARLRFKSPNLFAFNSHCVLNIRASLLGLLL